MACLGAVLYDPATAATAATSALAAMTALDTTNARITFTVPANGEVLVRIRVAGKGATGLPGILLGVLEGATVKGRQSPIGPRFNGTATGLKPFEVAFIVTGLTPAANLTWDAAFGVESLLASTTIGWGGPDDATTSNAYGALSFEVWETTNLLAGVHYDPAVAVTKSTATLIAMTALDTTNLRLTFTVPASGRVLVRERCTSFGASTSFASVHFGVLQAGVLKGRSAAYGFATNNVNTTDPVTVQSEFVVSGLTPAANLTWDAAYSVETIVALTQLAYGGPNDATAVNAYGGFAYEIWAA